MRKLLFFLILLTQTVLLSAQVVFQKTYGYSGYEWANGGIKTSDGGFIMVGTSYTSTNGTDIYVVKTDSVGIMQWANLYGIINNVQGSKIIQTADGGYLVTGSYDINQNEQELLLLKLTHTGNINWTRAYGVYDNIHGYSCDGYHILQTTDKGFLVSGSSNYGMYMYIIKTDSVGVQQSSHVFDVASGSMQKTFDGNYILTGFVNNYSVIYVVKITTNGTPLWEKFISSTGNNLSLSSLQQTPDKGFIMGGTVSSSSTNISTPCLIKTDSAVTPQWAKSYNLPGSSGSTVMQIQNGGYSLSAMDYYGKNVYLLKTAFDGNLQSAAAYGDTSISGVRTLIWEATQTPDKGFAMFGQTTGAGGSNTTFYFIKTDSLLNSGCYQWPINPLTSTITVSNFTQTVIKTVNGHDSIINLSQSSSGTEYVQCYGVSGINKIQQQNNVITYPNPSNGNFVIETTNTDKQTLQILDVTGKLVLQQTINGKTIIDAIGFDNGIYFVQINTTEGFYTKKIIVQK